MGHDQQTPSAANGSAAQGPIRSGYIDVAIVVISAAMLMFEVLQTITLSLQTIQRNAFLVVSLCLLGLGGGGSIATWLVTRTALRPVSVLWGTGVLFGLSLVASTLLQSWTVDMMRLIVLGVIPYLFVGIFLSYLFRTWPARANRSYFFNLLGSGLGCLGLVLALNGTGDAGRTTLIIGTMALVSASLIAVSLSRLRVVAPLVLAVALILMVPASNRIFAFLPSPDKGLGMIVDNPEIDSRVTWSKWSYLGRLDVIGLGEGIEKFPYGGPVIASLIDRGCDVQIFFASGGNWTKSVDFKDNTRVRNNFVKLSIHSAPFALVSEPDVLNIGFGAGVDIFLSLQHDARSVVGVDINPLMVEAGRYLDDYYDGFYNDPRVTIEVMDGRTYVRNCRRKFDVISLTRVDTGALLHSNAHVLMENYLYTPEAFDDYLRILSDNGVIYVSRPYREMMRTVVTAVQALRGIGIENPQDHIAIIGDDTFNKLTWRSAIVSKTPLTQPQRHSLIDRYPDGISFLAGYEGGDEFQQRYFQAVARGTDERFLSRQELNFTPVTDDRPFFYQFGHNVLESDAGRLLTRILGFVVVAALVLIIAPLLFVRRERVRGRSIVGVIGYFAAIGAGFMFIEIVMIQKLVLFLGHPSYSVTVTLFSILVFAGVGSIFAARLDARSPRTPVMIWVPILAAAVFYAVGLGPVLSAIHTESLPARVVIAALLLVPGSFFMGMPFPSMIRLMGRSEADFIPWAWAINAFVSVVTSVVTVLLALQYGFTTVLYLGAIFYLVALLFYFYRLRLVEN